MPTTSVGIFKMPLFYNKLRMFIIDQQQIHLATDHRNNAHFALNFIFEFPVLEFLTTEIPNSSFS